MTLTRVVVQFDLETGEAVRSLSSEPIPPACPLCCWIVNRVGHAPWCPDPGFIVDDREYQVLPF